MKTHMLKAFYGLIAVCFLLTSIGFAKTYYVGGCKGAGYPTISAAVKVAPPGSRVAVCPGTYPEQVFITQELTLVGISSGTAGRARITVPSVVGGPPNWTFVPDPDGGPIMVAPQIYVNSPAGAVTIENLTIDASGETTAPPCGGSGGWDTTAILLENSSSTIKGVNTVGQGKNSGCGWGIRDFAAAPATLSLTNSSLQDANEVGLHLDGAGLSASVKGNVLDVTSFAFAILSYNASGTVSSNIINASSSNLVYDSGTGGSITYSDNVLRGTTGCFEGVLLERAAQVTGNKIDGCIAGIEINAYSTYAVTIKTNLIVNNVSTAVALECASDVTLSGNTVNNAAVGVDSALSPVLASQITFDNVDTLA